MERRRSWRLPWLARVLAAVRNGSRREPGRGGPGLFRLLQQAAVVGTASRHHIKALADLYLELPMSEWGLLEFEAGDAMAARGYEEGTAGSAPSP